MSTRGLVCVYSGGQYKAATYNHSDSYPSSLGVETLTFLNSIEPAELQKGLNHITSLSSPEIKNRWKALGVPDGAHIGYEEEEKFKNAHPLLTQVPGDELLKFIANCSSPTELASSLTFASDSLFCEWCYVVDLDKNTFEVFKGFNESPLESDERFFFLNKESYKDHRTNQYRPVKLVKSYQLNNLPDDDDFLFEVDPPDPDDE